MDAAALARENALARLTEVEAALTEAQEANRRLEDILRTSLREKFGAKSGKLSPDQFNLPLEDEPPRRHRFEPGGERTGPGRARGCAGEAEAALRGKGAETPRKPRRNRGHLPPHLPRIERVIEPASTRWSPLERHWSE